MRPCKLSEQELERKVPAEASWHRDYDDSSWIIVKNLPFRATEGDLLTWFSQFGQLEYVEVVKRNGSGESSGLAILKYIDQRSTALAVDNIDGTTLTGRTINVDHMESSTHLEEKIINSPYLVARLDQ